MILSSLMFLFLLTATPPDFSMCDAIPLITTYTRHYPYIVAGKSYQINPLLVLAVVTQESGGNPHALSPAGARGLMQIMPQTAALLGCRTDDLYDPSANLRCGIMFLAALLTYTKGDLIKALSGYNAGSYSTERSPLLGGRIADNPETREYVRKVLSYFDRYKKRHPCR